MSMSVEKQILNGCTEPCNHIRQISAILIRSLRRPHQAPSLNELLAELPAIDTKATPKASLNAREVHKSKCCSWCQDLSENLSRRQCETVLLE
ncbi:hypothetical protein TcWFU_008597 [Taenia crassiceps]|uniref:Uncharacterized protein n=1 Tax=Taenia crassiceps TaxID=6207 RepID=A0ABR4Q9P4_9CEST